MYSILQNNELTIEIQPKYDLKTGKCISAEALARWKHPVFGNISPNEFIPIAETIGMINDIDMFVLETVCKYMRSWMDMGIQPVPVSVNQSRMHISDPNYVNSVFALMQIHKKALPAECLFYFMFLNAVGVIPSYRLKSLQK